VSFPPQSRTEHPQPPAGAMESPLIFDRAGMSARLMDDEALIQIVLHEFLADMPLQLKALRLLFNERDMDGVLRKAHMIKGAAANVGGEALRAVACAMESACKGGNIDSAAALMDACELHFQQLKSAMIRKD